MKKYAIIFGLILAVTLGLCEESSAQQTPCGSTAWLDELINNNQVTFEFLTSTGQPTTTVNPSTSYILRVTATANCLTNEFGCAGVASVAFLVEFANNATIDGKTVPPETAGQDVGSATNYSADFIIETNPPSTFGGQVVVLYRILGLEAQPCNIQFSSNLATFNSNDL